MTSTAYRLDDFDYFLPPELIAQTPTAQRSASRLLELRGMERYDRHFSDLAELLRAGDLLVVNDTRVAHARLVGRKESGGQVEVLVERVLGGREVLAQVRASKSPKPGSRLYLTAADGGADLVVEVLGRQDEFYRLAFQGDALAMIERHGRLPLPPYIERAAALPDETRYQTVYARAIGSVAAPTAGLHFDEDLLQRLQDRGVGLARVTLHVGAGTFQPVRVQDLTQHPMHSERYEMPTATVAAIKATRAAGGRVVAVGTTSLRALESAADVDAPGNVKVGAGETALFITPGYEFRVVDVLVTNFHLPKSTLLMLTAAFGGYDAVRAAYRWAIDANYRFFSYGDAMLIHKASGDR